MNALTEAQREARLDRIRREAEAVRRLGIVAARNDHHVLGWTLPADWDPGDPGTDDSVALWGLPVTFAGAHIVAHTAEGEDYTEEPSLEDATTLDDMLATGATYRQIDYWVRKGYLTPERGTPGSGYDRRWSERDVRLCSMIVRLSKVVHVETAVEWARQALDTPGPWEQTKDGLTIMWTMEGT